MLTPDSTGALVPWHTQAACRGTDLDLWFRREKELVRRWNVRANRALGVCAKCPVRHECLAASLVETSEEHGIRGGILPKRIRAIRHALCAEIDSPRPTCDDALAFLQRHPGLESCDIADEGVKVHA